MWYARSWESHAKGPAAVMKDLLSKAQPLCLAVLSAALNHQMAIKAVVLEQSVESWFREGDGRRATQNSRLTNNNGPHI